MVLRCLSNIICLFVYRINVRWRQRCVCSAAVRLRENLQRLPSFRRDAFYFTVWPFCHAIVFLNFFYSEWNATRLTFTLSINLTSTEFETLPGSTHKENMSSMGAAIFVTNEGLWTFNYKRHGLQGDSDLCW